MTHIDDEEETDIDDEEETDFESYTCQFCGCELGEDVTTSEEAQQPGLLLCEDCREEMDGDGL